VTNRQELKIVKGRAQNTLETIELLVTFTVMFYIIRPDLREKHTSYLRTKRNAVAHWISVQHTIASIRNLPETDTQDVSVHVTRNREA
jgi:hypothetical protein